MTAPVVESARSSHPSLVATLAAHPNRRLIRALTGADGLRFPHHPWRRRSSGL